MWFCEKPVCILCIHLYYKQIGTVQFICILLLITGIEQNPGPTANSEAIPFKVVAAGTFHQGQTDQFSDQSFGRQYVPSSVAAIAFSKLKHTTKWASLHMNNILQEGDALYKQIHSSHDFLEFEEVPTHIKLFSNDFTIYKISDIYGSIHKTVIEKALNKKPGCDPIHQHVLIVTQTGKAAYNIHGTTIH